MKWHYKLITADPVVTDEEWMAKLDKYGMEGWEAVSMTLNKHDERTVLLKKLVVK